MWRVRKTVHLNICTTHFKHMYMFYIVTLSSKTRSNQLTTGRPGNFTSLRPLPAAVVQGWRAAPGNNVCLSDCTGMKSVSAGEQLW